MSLVHALAALPADFGLIPADDGAFTLKENGLFVHSSRAPLAEALRFIENAPIKKGQVFVLWGMGLGYHAQMLIDKGCTVIGVETRPGCVRILKEVFPLDKLYAFITENPKEHIFSAVASLDPREAQGFTDMIMRGSEPSPDAQFAVEKAKHAQFSSNRIYSHLMDSWHHHILLNLASIPTLARYPENAFSGMPVLVCSAGPSLKESLPHIKRLRSKLVIIAVDTAFTALVEAGIYPDFLHAVDAKVHNIGDFAGIPDDVFSRTVLLADLTLSSEVLQKPWKHIEILMTAHPIIHPKKGFCFKSIALLEHLTSLGLDICRLQTGGSVATSAFHYALGHGASLVLLVGQDLAYSNHRGHSIGTPYDSEYRCSVSRMKPYDTIPLKKIPPDAHMVEGIGAGVLVDPLLSQFRSWFEVSIADNLGLKAICINASESGALFKGWKHQKLSQIFLEKYGAAHLPEPVLRANPYQRIVLQTLPLWQDEDSPLHREYFYRETLQRIEDKPVDGFSYGRKLKRMHQTLQKIRGAI